MASRLEIPCAGCKALYRLVVNSPDVSALFLCVQCGEHNLYHVGATFRLDPRIMRHGSERERKQHIRRRMEDSALEMLANMRRRLDALVNINVDVEFAKRIDPPELQLQPPDAPGAAAPGVDRPSPAEEAAEEAAGVEDEPSDEEPDPDRPISESEVEAFRSLLDSPDVWRHLNLP